MIVILRRDFRRAVSLSCSASLGFPSGLRVAMAGKLSFFVVRESDCLFEGGKMALHIYKMAYVHEIAKRGSTCKA